jgi:hypothetical protein
MPCRLTRRLPACAHASLLLAAPLGAQGTIRGRVLADSGGAPVGGAELRLLGLPGRATADSSGRFSFTGIPKGGHVLVVSAVGFAADTSEVEFASNETLFKDVMLRRTAQPLAPVNVRAAGARIETGWRGDFARRREAGIGRQLDRAVLEKYASRSVADLLATRVPGVDVRRGTGGKAWASSGRAVGSGGCAFCRSGAGSVLDPADRASGATRGCDLDVYLDGANVYSMPAPSATERKTPQLFNLDFLRPEAIEAIEV